MSAVIHFSIHPVTSQVFFKSLYTFALVNLKPLVPGHVLVVPLRVVPRLKDLTPVESQDYFEVLQRIHRFIEHIYKADSLNIAIQDGIAAGQSVPHLHTHIIPRYVQDGYGDGIYSKLEDNEQSLQYTYKRFHATPDANRKPRTLEEMTKEAEWLQAELLKFEEQNIL